MSEAEASVSAADQVAVLVCFGQRNRIVSFASAGTTSVADVCALRKAIGEVFQDILPPDQKGTELILQVRIVCVRTVL